MRVTSEGRLVAIVHRPAREGTRNGVAWAEPDTDLALIVSDFNDWPARVLLSPAQVGELNKPENFGALLSVTGAMVKDGFVQAIECGQFALVEPSTVNA